MKLLLKSSVLLLLVTISFHISCKKEYSCEGCATKSNKPPIANAGPDQLITLPTDSVSLNGINSSDPDGTISVWLWTKISGPASFNIIKPTDTTIRVKALIAGTYQFELNVTDNGGLSAKDTVQIKVDATIPTNHPPVANAGPNQTIILPANAINLDGRGSADPDNNITSYLWTKISGPSSFNILNINATQTQVTNLVEGIYKLKLKVTDAGSLFSQDTVQINVQLTPPPPVANCNVSNRSLIQAQLIPVGTLSQTRSGVSIATVGNKILFAGGDIVSNGSSSRVDIFDITNNLWSIAELSEARSGISSATFGNKILFGGGGNYNGNSFSKKVDIYDLASNTWSTSELSLARTSMAAVAINNKVFFAGGVYHITPTADVLFTDKVDIYDILSNSWSTAVLSQPRAEFTASVAGNKIYFAGGTNYLNLVNDYGSTSVIDIYDASNNSWSISSLSTAKGTHAGIAVNNKIYWAGGRGDGCLNSTGCCTVEIKDVNTQTSSFSNLFQPNAYFEAVLKDNKIVFFTGAGNSSNQFDIYDTSNNSWSIGVLPNNISGSIISVNNIIYIAGAVIDGVLSNQVWKLEF